MPSQTPIPIVTKRPLFVSFRMRKSILSILPTLLLPLLLVACATQHIDWNTRVGHYTYDDAIKELGVPDRYATLSDGSIVAEWLQGRGRAYANSYPSRFQTMDIIKFPDSYLRLIFSPDLQLQKAGKFAR